MNPWRDDARRQRPSASSRTGGAGIRPEAERYDEADLPALGLWKLELASDPKGAQRDALVGELRLDLERFVELSLLRHMKADAESPEEPWRIGERRPVARLEVRERG